MGRLLSASVLIRLAAGMFFPLTGAGAAETPRLVKDISPSQENGSAPRDFCAVNGILFFTADDGTHGRELWKSDGTAAGTVLVKDIHPAPGSEFDQEQPYHLIASGSILYFTVVDAAHGRELWKSDGTAEGTKLVKDIRSGSAGSDPTRLTLAGGMLYFRASNGTNGAELWKSDGTEAGTVMVKDIASGPATAGSNPDSLTAAGAILYFTADDGISGEEVWKSDGTPGGTVMVKDIYTGGDDPAVYPPYYLTAVGNTLYFTANDGISGEEVWKSDGTPEGTELVKDIYTGSGDIYPHTLAAAGGLLYFVADDGAHGPELWKSDGTPGGTVMVKDIAVSDQAYPFYLTPAAGGLYFVADDGEHGNELWKTDGSAEGTVMIKDLAAGTGSGVSEFSRMTAVGSNLYFTAFENVWITDGTSAGTLPIGQPTLPEEVHSPESLTWINGRLYFSAYVPAYGRELFVHEPGAAAGDSDSDGLADAWETSAFGSLEFDAGDDPDSDGQSNAAEQLTGFDPADGSDFLRLECTRTAAGAVTCRINQVRIGITYTLQSGDGSAWATVQTAVFPQAGHGDIADPRSVLPASVFYRVTAAPADP